MIPFAPPQIDQKIIDAVTEVLKSGWITTGPKTKQFEDNLTTYCGNKATLALNSATAGLELMLRWFEVTEGDEVIIPAYTYSATANVVVHCGATPVFIDTNADDFNINIQAIKKAITPKTKVIMPVDIAGLPCDYDAIHELINLPEIKQQFNPNGINQETLGRILVLSDAAHSIGGSYKGKKVGSLTDISVVSFHAVKNLTTAEGGAVLLNLPEGFDNAGIYSYLRTKSLHGQTKDAFSKNKPGMWEYDIIEPGYKANMTDILAAIGLVELDRYESQRLPERKAIVEKYNKGFAQFSWAQLPIFKDENRESSYHLYQLRIKGFGEEDRNKVIQEAAEKGVSTNVHFKPLPMMSYYKSVGYDINLYPTTYNNYACEITLPIFYGLTDEQINTVINTVSKAVEEVLAVKQ